MSLLSRFCLRSNLSFLSGAICRGRYLSSTNYYNNRVRVKSVNHPEKTQVFFRLYGSDTVMEPCWRCGQFERRAHFFCQNCDALQEPNSKFNYFHLLGVRETYDINPRELSMKFRQLQAVLHPDKFTNATDNEQRYSADWSSAVNKAYHTLSDPLERGLYFLRQQGSIAAEENSSLNETFLMKIMELNEELEAISTSEELRDFNSKIAETVVSIQKRISESFANQDTESAKAGLTEMKYYTTLETKIKEKMLQLGTL